MPLQSTYLACFWLFILRNCKPRISSLKTFCKAYTFKDIKSKSSFPKTLVKYLLGRGLSQTVVPTGKLSALPHSLYSQHITSPHLCLTYRHHPLPQKPQAPIPFCSSGCFSHLTLLVSMFCESSVLTYIIKSAFFFFLLVNVFYQFITQPKDLGGWKETFLFNTSVPSAR